MDKKKGCSSCKKDGLTLREWIMIAVGFFVLGTSIYGTIQLIKELF